MVTEIDYMEEALLQQAMYEGLKEIRPEYHEHPSYTGHYHRAVWGQTWASNGTEDKAPEGTPFTCTVCGRFGWV